MTACARCSEGCLHKLCMHKVPIFSSLNQEELLHIASLINHRAYKKGETLFAEGDFFGERNLFGRHTAAYTVQALVPVKTCSLSKENFHKLLHAHPDIAVKIIEELEKRMARMEGAFQSMGVRNVDNRISALLLDFARKYGSAVPEGILIRLPLSREGMANYLGIARETVSRKLGQLESEGVIRSLSNKSILVLDRGALELSAGISS